MVVWPELAPALQVPPRRGLVEQLEGMLVHDELPAGAEQRVDPVERRVELVHVVERPARDDRIERPGVVELGKRRAAKDRPVGGARIDRDDVVTGAVHAPGEVAAPAADLEHARRRRR
jgi:hypothetical protein